MSARVMIVERVPEAEEYLELIASVGWRPRERGAVEVALRNSLYAVCGEREGLVIGCGRVIGDGGLHLYLTDIIVRPPHQRQGIGTRIVAALTRYVESLPHPNLLAAVLPTPGLADFYARHGYRAQPADSPAMLKWVNPK